MITSLFLALVVEGAAFLSLETEEFLLDDEPFFVGSGLAPRVELLVTFFRRTLDVRAMIEL